MNKLLFVGDPHVTPSNLEDSKNLANFILEKVKENECPVIISGDEYNFHGIVNLEVQKFWFDFYDKLNNSPYCKSRYLYENGGENISSITLIGNHDTVLGHPEFNALTAHSDQTLVVDKPFVHNNILYVSYCHNSEDFINICNEYKEIPTVICHQTFQGAQFNEGYFAKDGIDQNLIPQKAVISGHIHRKSILGKVHYLGSPRWINLNDANIDKAIWLLEFDDAGNLLHKTPFDTSGVCRKIIHIVVNEDTDLNNLNLNPNHDNRVDIKGPAVFVDKAKELLNNCHNVKIRTFKTDKKQSIIKESDGLKVAFSKYINTYQPKEADKEELTKIFEDRYAKYFK